MRKIRAGLFALLLLGSTAFAQIGDPLGLSPFWNWKTIETEHFRLSFPVELEATARKSGQYLEEAHAALSPKLYWQPYYKTQILVVDNADEANGLTTPVGRFGIMFIVTPPDQTFSTQYYDEWLRLLAFHEYTHLLNMDATRSFYTPLRYLFGDVLLPNAAWPSWMLEGLAVYMETRFTHAGRGRSPYYDMLLRSAVEANVLDTSKYVTLDKVNGPNPYFPYGETAYAFGYELMNQVAEGGGDHKSEDLLGIMSETSSYRIPFFINGNLENISGKDWYHNWDDLMTKVRKKSGADLATIRSQPLSHLEPLTHDGGMKLGTTASPDGNWLAYNSDSPEEEANLYLKNLKTGDISQVDETVLGGEMSFTPDSSAVIYSSIERKAHYYQWSDLKVHDVRHDKSYWISDSLRARDPNVSRDGKWVVFTVVIDQTIALCRAPLEFDGNRYKLGTLETLYFPEKYDAVYSPKFSLDGNRVYFNLHHNGNFSQELMGLDLKTHQLRVLVGNGHMNHFPMVREGSQHEEELFFVSDLTGADNLYRYREALAPQMVSNVTTGIQFPAAGPDGKIYAQTFSYKGWDVSRIDLLEKPINPESVALLPIDHPEPDAQSTDHAHGEQYQMKDYSIFPSIWPRQWAPILFVNPQSVYLGGEVVGFDAVDLHSYLLEGAYDTLTKKADYYILYTNRQAGVSINASTDMTTTGIYTNTQGQLDAYVRRRRYTVSADYSFLWTFSSLTPYVAVHGEQNYLYVPGANPSNSDIVATGTYVPYLDGFLTYASGQSTRLAISAEQGRTTEIGTRVYPTLGTAVVKQFVQDTEYVRTDALIKHSVLVPSLQFSAVDHESDYANARVVVAGRASGQVLSGIPTPSLDHLAIRGYTNELFYVRQAGVGSLDYRFPFAEVFRGWGTNPAFLNQISGFVFAECSFYPTTEIGARGLPSTGGGINFNTTFFNSLPIVLTTEYNKGFREDLGGKGEFFFQLGVPAINL